MFFVRLSVLLALMATMLIGCNSSSSTTASKKEDGKKGGEPEGTMMQPDDKPISLDPKTGYETLFAPREVK